MMNHYKSAAVSLVLTLVITQTAATSTTSTTASSNSDRVLLADVKALTLYQGRMTTSCRASPIPQLKCVGGTAQCKVTPETVQCINSGSDGSSIQWECKASMNSAYRLGRVHVSCEGFDHPKDQYILKGSCGLEYTVDLTGGKPHHPHAPKDEKKYVVGGFIVLIGLVILVILVILVCVIISVCQNQRSQPVAPTYVQGPPPPYGGCSALAYGPPPGYGDYDNRCDSSGSGGAGGMFDSSDNDDNVITSAFGDTSGR